MAEELAVSRELHTSAQRLCGKSWTAYFQLLLAASFLATIGYSIAVLMSNTLAYGVLAILLLVVIYRFFLLRSQVLFMDDHGVWLADGVFPWDRMISGVKWRDLDEAVYRPTLWGWLFRSYTVALRHRFTKQDEIALSQMHQGHTATELINEQHRAWLVEHHPGTP
ncbi:MAG: hypothetical protein BWK76_25295 [Desulfobulbaceae bacterium A2]|nr:MAG: hypothetical protein BWK76_25295 [Desulfobulbaceae bacterium A2]